VTDKHNAKISLSNIANLQQLLDEVPARSDTELSKRRAIVMLAPKLYGLRQKGYSWRAVAEWLSEHGLIVTAPALQGYLRGAQKAAGPNGKTRQRKRGRSQATTAATGASRDGQTTEPITAVVTPARIEQSASVVSAHAREMTSPIAQRSEQPARRSAFIPRPDSEKI
jgi:hypothetical protein